MIGVQPPGPRCPAPWEAALPSLYACRPGAVQCRRGGGLGAAEEPASYRLYNCRGCGMQVRICARCDRGNIYCAGQCAKLAVGSRCAAPARATSAPCVERADTPRGNGASGNDDSRSDASGISPGDEGVQRIGASDPREWIERCGLRRAYPPLPCAFCRAAVRSAAGHCPPLPGFSPGTGADECRSGRCSRVRP